jgi:hypothetical protein
MKQSAVEWLDEKLNAIRLDVDRNAINFIDLSIQKAKEMEKEQQGYSEEYMKKAYCNGANLDYNIMISTKEGNEILGKWFEQFKKK